jgi:L-alanine-DL-glutamate epimerase-like enolase superfamily enzyme
VIADGGAAGFGFSLGMDPAVARDMAAWDAWARSRGLALWRALGRRRSPRVPLEKDGEPALKPDWEAARRAMAEKRYRLLRVDPFAWGSLEMVQTIAGAAAELKIPLALLAPNGHPWEIAWCAALAGDPDRVIVRAEPTASFLESPDAPGSGVDWSLEPAFGAVRWLGP